MRPTDFQLEFASLSEARLAARDISRGWEGEAVIIASNPSPATAIRYPRRTRSYWVEAPLAPDERLLSHERIVARYHHGRLYEPKAQEKD